jgi:hypothetical protein
MQCFIVITAVSVSCPLRAFAGPAQLAAVLAAHAVCVLSEGISPWGSAHTGMLDLNKLQAALQHHGVCHVLAANIFWRVCANATERHHKWHLLH